MLFVSTAYVPSPNKQLPQLLGAVRVWFFSRTLAFVNINNQSLRKEVGWSVEYGWWGQKDLVKQAVQSFYIHWMESWMDWISKHFKQNFLQKKIKSSSPILLRNLFFRNAPPGDSQVHWPLDFFSWRSPTMALLKWVTFLPQGRPPGEDFHCQVMPKRVESESPGKEPRVGDNKWPTQPAKPVGLGIPPLFWNLAVILGGKDFFERDGAWDGVQRFFVDTYWYIKRKTWPPPGVIGYTFVQEKSTWKKSSFFNSASSFFQKTP